MIHFVTTTPRRDVCPRCHALRLVGIAEGLPYRVAPVPLTAHGELRALLAGRRSYAISAAGRLIHRNRDRIRGDKRGRPVVFAWHVHAPPDPADVDARHVAAVLAYLDRLREREAGDADADPALFAVVTGLGGRVISLTPRDDRPPF
jgi:hypothetical protein